MMRVTRILFLFASLLGVGMGLIALRTESAQTGYMLGQLQDEEARLKRQCMEYQLEMARLRNPVRLEEENRRLGLDLELPTYDDRLLPDDYIVDE